MACWGEGPGKPACRTPPKIRTIRLLVPAGSREADPMDFCGRHFWIWNATSLELRSEPELNFAARAIRANVDSGTFDRAPPAPVEAIPFAMVAPDYGFDAGPDEQEQSASDEEE